MPQEILVHKITRSGIEELNFDLPDFDSITTMLPSGLYTTFRTYADRTKVLGLRSHLERLYIPAKAQAIVPAIRKQDALRDVLSELLVRLGGAEARVRLILDTSVEPGIIYVLLQRLPSIPAEIYTEGVRLETSRSSREKPSLKQTAFITESAFDRTRVGGPVFEILLMNKGRILEGMTSNFFYINNGVLSTAGRGVLIGVTRQTVLALARQAGLNTSIRALTLNELQNIDEAFITSSSRGIVPVIQIDEQQIADGKVGTITKKLMKQYEENVLSLAEDII